MKSPDLLSLYRPRSSPPPPPPHRPFVLLRSLSDRFNWALSTLRPIPGSVCVLPSHRTLLCLTGGLVVATIDLSIGFHWLRLIHRSGGEGLGREKTLDEMNKELSSSFIRLLGLFGRTRSANVFRNTFRSIRRHRLILTPKNVLVRAT